MNLFKNLVKKYGLSMILCAATLDGYISQIINERKNNILEGIQKEKNYLSEDRKVGVEEISNNTKNKDAIGKYTEAADEHKKAVDNADPSDNNEMIRSHKNLDDSFAEIKKLDMTEIFTSLYNKYGEYLDSLTPDKIVCLFNIIIEGLILSSFFSVLTIMLSENIINKIGFLEKYPRILKLIQLRNNINKKISKIYLLIHFILIIIGILANIYMFFL
jgi:hypothetical protein